MNARLILQVFLAVYDNFFFHTPMCNFNSTKAFMPHKLKASMPYDW